MANAPGGDPRRAAAGSTPRRSSSRTTSWVGIGAIVLKGVRIGAGARVGAGRGRHARRARRARGSRATRRGRRCVTAPGCARARLVSRPSCRPTSRSATGAGCTAPTPSSTSAASATAPCVIGAHSGVYVGTLLRPRARRLRRARRLLHDRRRDHRHQRPGRDRRPRLHRARGGHRRQPRPVRRPTRGATPSARRGRHRPDRLGRARGGAARRRAHRRGRDRRRRRGRRLRGPALATAAGNPARSSGARRPAPAQRPEHVREVVGPHPRARVAPAGAPAEPPQHGAGRASSPPRSTSPSASRPARRHLEPLDRAGQAAGRRARLPSTGSKSTNRFEMLNSIIPPGRRRSQVERQRLAREQVHGHGVGGERVDRDQAELAARLALERLAAVAELHVELAGAVAQVGEQPRVAGDARHGRVDLEERPALAGPRVARHPARAEPDDRGPRRRAVRARRPSRGTAGRPGPTGCSRRAARGGPGPTRSTPWIGRPVVDRVVARRPPRP